MSNKGAILLLFSCLYAVSCDPDMVYDHFEHTARGVWSWEDAKTFPVNIQDTTAMHDIYLQVRHTVDYPMSNLYMFVEIEGPGGQHLKDTVNLVLSEPDGKWIGSGLGKLREIRLLYRRQTRFRESGEYLFRVEQAMRNPDLPVTDVGLRIERNNTR